MEDNRWVDRTHGTRQNSFAIKKSFGGQAIHMVVSIISDRNVSGTSFTLLILKEISTWTPFKWAESNDISATLQSLSIGNHPLSSRLPRRMLTQHLAPSDQQQATPTERCATCVQSLFVPTLLHTDGNIHKHDRRNRLRQWYGKYCDKTSYCRVKAQELWWTMHTETRNQAPLFSLKISSALVQR